MGYYHPGRHASVSRFWPRAFAVCDRCGFVYNHKDLIWQNQWTGPRLSNLRILVCESCLDKPQEQLRTFTFPPDPVPIDTPRPENYAAIVNNDLSTQDSDNLMTQGNDNLIAEIEDVPSPDPNNPAIYP